VTYGYIYSLTNKDVKTESYGGDYYRAQSECDRRGAGCWGFQTTKGCTDGLGCSQALIIHDPEDAKMLDVPATTIYTKKTWTWDAVPIECSGLTQDTAATEIGECEFNCTDDLDCEMYQWHEDNTCWRGKSSDCTGTTQIQEGYRMRPIYWSFTKNQCDDLKHDGTADGSIAQCEYNCQWDLTCEIYQYYSNDKCYRGKSDDCNRHEVRVVSGGKKDYKFMFKTLKNQCSGLTLDSHATSFQDCKGNCKSDDDCSVWQFYLNGQCWRGHPTTCSAERDARVVKGGYRWYINNGDSEEDEDVEAEGEVETPTCPDGYDAIDENLDGEGKEWSNHDASRTIEDCAQICDERSGCTAFEYKTGGFGSCGTYTAGTDNIQDDEDRTDPSSTWRSCVVALPEFSRASGWKGGVASDCDNLGCQTVDSVASCANICSGEEECNVFNYCPEGADCTSGAGRCCSRKCDSTDKHDLQLTSIWKGWDVYTKDPSSDEEENDAQVQCPQGYSALAFDGNFLGADFGGSGIGGSDSRFGQQTPQDCAQKCEDNAECEAFSFAPVGGDRNHGDTAVCTIYNAEDSTPNQRWAGVNGEYSQIFCSRDVQCPQGYWALGWDGHLRGADHGGCGIKGCDDTHSQDFHTPKACAKRCEDDEDCVAFSFAPAGGDKNQGDNTVCRLYADEDSTPNQRWAGVNGDYSEIFCKSTEKSRQSFLSGQREANGREGHTCGYLTDFVHVPRDFKNHGHDQRTHQTHGHTQECADICQNEYGCVGFEYDFDGKHDHDCHTYHGVAENDIIDDDEENDGWLSCVPVEPKEALPKFTLTSRWNDGVAADCHSLGCQTVDSASTCANICFGDKDCNVFNYCPKGADCSSGEGRCCSRKCHSTSKHDLELTHEWKGWDVYTKNDRRRNLKSHHCSLSTPKCGCPPGTTTINKYDHHGCVTACHCQVGRRALQEGTSRRLFQLLSDVQAF
jgi:hypothetical protein